MILAVLAALLAAADEPIELPAAPADAAPAIQSALARDAGHRRTVRLPAGTFLLKQAVSLPPYAELAGAGMDATTLEGALPTPLIVGGSKGDPNYGGRYPRSDGCGLRDLTLKQGPGGTVYSKCAAFDGCDDVRVSRVRFQGSEYEGLVAGVWNKRMLVEDCEALECGNGGPRYRLTTAGFNAIAQDLTMVRCRARRCGQGFETGNTRVRLLDCSAVEPAGNTPSLAFNIGSCVAGISQTTLDGCSSRGYETAVSVGNGIGRMSGVCVQNCRFEDGAVSFQGGRAKNHVPHADEGPDTSGSVVRNCTLLFRKPCSGAVGYSLGPAAEPLAADDARHYAGREPLTVEGCEVRFELPSGAVQIAPVFFVAGPVSAAVRFERCTVRGLANPAARGDFAVFPFNDNVIARPLRNVRCGNCRAFGPGGQERPFDIRRGDAPPPAKAKVAAKPAR